jgi:ADP-ribose pyrophosphatase
MPKSRKQDKARVRSSKVVYRGPLFHVTAEEITEPGGVRVRRDVVRHQGSVVILAVEESGGEPRVLLARQYRHAAGGYLWELPAGRLDSGETALEGARRELEEETGYTARQWKKILFFYVSPGFVDESMSVYLARGLKPGRARPEEDERIRKRLFPLSAAVRMAVRGGIRDAKTIAGVLWLERDFDGARVAEGRPAGRRAGRGRGAKGPRIEAAE